MAAKTKTQATGKTPAPVSEPKPIRLPLTVMPSKNGKRKTMVSAAPEGEMPVIRTGLFADRHALLDEVWGELQHRKPQVVKIKADQPSGNGKPKTEAPLTGGLERAEQEQAEFETEVFGSPTPANEPRESDALGAGSATEEAPAPPADLPLIEEATPAPQLALDI